MVLVGAPTARKTSVGRDVVVAVVDTGVDLHHEDLPASRLVVLPGANLINPGQPPQDDHGHGTHVAGIVGAEVGNGVGVEGVAPGTKLMPVKVLDSSGTSEGSSVEDGIRFAADHGARVINVSIGVQLVQPVTGPGFEPAVEYAWSKGAVCVVAAGNNYNGGVLGSGYSSDTHAIVVAATDRNDSPATYSSGSNGARWGMAAPGGADPNLRPAADTIYSTYWVAGEVNQYEYNAGTSMAAPHVSGAVADLLALGLTPQQAVDRVLATAKKGLAASLGAGRLDVAAAVAGRGGLAVTTTTGKSASSSSPSSGTAAKPAGSRSSATTRAVGEAPSPLELGAPSEATSAASPTSSGAARPLSSRPAGHDSALPFVLLALVAVLGSGLLVARRLQQSRLALRGSRDGRN